MDEKQLDTSSSSISIKVKGTRETYQLTIPENSTVKDVKEELVAKVDAPVERLCLIFSGRILKDNETLKQQGVGDGFTIHLVVRISQKPTSAATPAYTTTTTSAGQTQPATPANPTGNVFGSLGASIPGFDTFAGAGTFAEMQQRLQQQRNPEIGHMLNNPELLRQVID
ncbi:unnamed protein product [Soboliphyme baturini]|uniref:Ubiquitin-like domain-containing protein n=1 Tax=Soboliphyme baturini TaxID=241478 RepID=A0A183J2E3_9BILA|nr:unnamed protein product [Soboliphyme baturini]